jgi:hypothetical protein
LLAKNEARKFDWQLKIIFPFMLSTGFILHNQVIDVNKEPVFSPLAAIIKS